MPVVTVASSCARGIDAAPAAAPATAAWDVLSPVNIFKGPYGTFGKVDDFKIVGTKSESRGKRDYRRVPMD